MFLVSELGTNNQEVLGIDDGIWEDVAEFFVFKRNETISLLETNNFTKKNWT